MVLITIIMQKHDATNASLIWDHQSGLKLFKFRELAPSSGIWKSTDRHSILHCLPTAHFTFALSSLLLLFNDSFVDLCLVPQADLLFFLSFFLALLFQLLLVVPRVCTSTAPVRTGLCIKVNSIFLVVTPRITLHSLHSLLASLLFILFFLPYFFSVVFFVYYLS